MKTLYLRSLLILLIMIGMMVGMAAAVVINNDYAAPVVNAPVKSNTVVVAAEPSARASLYVTIP